jgi:uncharacterized repeat protein (TIGR01451 family)
MADFVPNLYRDGVLFPAQIRLNGEVGGDTNDFRIHNPDIMGPSSPYNNHLIPYRAELRDGSNDSSQLNWWYNENNFQIHESIGFMYYPGLSGYFPLSESLAELLNNNLFQETQNYVNSYEINQPWWWLTDLAASTTTGGEHLYHSPTVSWTMFQTKAHVLKEEWNTLVRQLPEPVSFNAKYDLYRLQNLVTLAKHPDAPQEPNISGSRISANKYYPKTGESVHFQIEIRNSGVAMSTPAQLTIMVPDGLEYVSNSMESTCGSTNDSLENILQWSGFVEEFSNCVVNFETTVTETQIKMIRLSTTVEIPDPPAQKNLSISIVSNGYPLHLPIIYRKLTQQ